jgi:hypothetical protein
MKDESIPFSPENQISPSTFRSAAEFRWCYYLHLHTASKTAVRWRERDGSSHPEFNVRGKKRLVFVRGYFEDKKFYGGDWCLIYQVTTKSDLPNGKKKPNHKPLGAVLPEDSRQSFVQTIPERYPLNLVEDAGKQRIEGIDRMTVTMTCKILDSITYRSGVQ